MSRDLLDWTVSRDAVGDWYWLLALPNGWTAIVSDHSHATAPEQMPRYNASVSSRAFIHSLPEWFDSLQSAKSAALSFALSQRVTV